MEAFFATFDTLDRIFLIMGVFGLVMFIGRMILMALGAGHHGDAHGGGFDAGGHDMAIDAVSGMDVSDLGHDAGGGHVDAGHAGAAGHDHGHSDSTADFNFWTLQGIIAFLMMAGACGLALHRGSGLNQSVSVVGSFAIGFCMMFVVAKLMQSLTRLSTSGNINMMRAIGQEGSVYLNIPPEGSGQVQVAVCERLKVLDAVSEDRQPIATGERVRVVDVLDGATLVVRRERLPLPIR